VEYLGSRRLGRLIQQNRIVAAINRRATNPPTMPPIAPFERPPEELEEEDEAVGPLAGDVLAPRRALLDVVRVVAALYSVMSVNDVIGDPNVSA
jgi:hypothetical protein